MSLSNLKYQTIRFYFLVVYLQCIPPPNNKQSKENLYNHAKKYPAKSILFLAEIFCSLLEQRSLRVTLLKNFSYSRLFTELVKTQSSSPL